MNIWAVVMLAEHLSKSIWTSSHVPFSLTLLGSRSKETHLYVLTNNANAAFFIFIFVARGLSLNPKPPMMDMKRFCIRTYQGDNHHSHVDLFQILCPRYLLYLRYSFPRIFWYVENTADEESRTILFLLIIFLDMFRWFRRWPDHHLTCCRCAVHSKLF